MTTMIADIDSPSSANALVSAEIGIRSESKTTRATTYSEVRSTEARIQRSAGSDPRGIECSTSALKD